MLSNMHLQQFLVTSAVLVAAAHAWCPSQHMDYDVVKRATEHEKARSHRLMPRSNINVDIYLHNVARGQTWDEGYVSVSPIHSDVVNTRADM